MGHKNPIEERVGKIADQWTDFKADPEARLLVWRVRADEAPIVEAFYERESDGDTARTPDMFLGFQAPSDAAHGRMDEALVEVARGAGGADTPDGQLHKAWDCGMRGLTVARQTDPDTLKTSTVAYLGEAMLRLTGRSEYSAYRRPLEEQLGGWLGPDWRPDPSRAPQTGAGS